MLARPELPVALLLTASMEPPQGQTDYVVIDAKAISKVCDTLDSARDLTSRIMVA